VKVLGTGEGFETLQTIAGPIKLRNSIITFTNDFVSSRSAATKR
jgi:hypothetical protein